MKNSNQKKTNLSLLFLLTCALSVALSTNYWLAFAEVVKEKVTFRYQPVISAQKVTLAGSFNNWDKNATLMSDEDGDGIWEVTLYLEPGEYQYKFVINDTVWVKDPNAKLTAPDGFGDFNSVIIVGKPKVAKKANKIGDGKIFADAILHNFNAINYFDPINENELLIRLRTAKNDISNCELILSTPIESTQQHIQFESKKPKKSVGIYIYGESTRPSVGVAITLEKPGLNRRTIKMRKIGSDKDYDFYETIVKSSKNSYIFKLTDGRKTILYTKKGITEKLPSIADYFDYDLSTVTIFKTPSWVKDAVFYQIFPERFYNGDTSNDPIDTQKWGDKPTWFNFFGGDLEGIIQKLPYLEELGITAIYLNPIFESLSNHKYDAIDYFKIDKHFGDLSTFHKLIKEAHKRGIKVILDAVFNHTADEHWAFQDIVKNGNKSPYWNWYFIYGYPITTNPRPNYECWWGFGDMPKLNYNNPEVREYILKVGKYWIDQGAAGWRLDVPNEVPHDFWKQFRIAVKSVNPDAYLVGEIWTSGFDWLKGDEFDAVMNYRFRNNVLDFFVNNSIDAETFLERMNQIRFDYPLQAYISLLNLLGTHDTPRVLTLANGDISKVKLAMIFQMTYPGAPSIYYGDEIGMLGEKDPDNRRCMIWEQENWNLELLNLYKQLIALRKRYNCLRSDVFIPLYTKDTVLAYARRDDTETILVVFNNNETPVKKVTIPLHSIGVRENSTLVDLLTGEKYRIKNGKLQFSVLPPRSGLILTPAY